MFPGSKHTLNNSFECNKVVLWKTKEKKLLKVNAEKDLKLHKHIVISFRI